MLRAFGDAQYLAVQAQWSNGEHLILDAERYVPSLALFRLAIAEQVEVLDTPVLRHIGGDPSPDDRRERGVVKQDERILDRSLAHAGDGRCTIESQSGFYLWCSLRGRSGFGAPWMLVRAVASPRLQYHSAPAET